MTRFIFRIAAFLAIPCALVTVWTLVVVSLDRRSYIESLEVPDGQDVAVCSDSQTRDGLNPEFMPRLYNFSAAAAQPDQNLLRLKDLMARNRGRLRYVLLDVTPIHVGFDERDKPLSSAESARVHALLHVYHWHDAARPLGSIGLLFRDVILDRKFNELRKTLKRKLPYRSSLAGGFCAVKSAGFIEQPKKANADLAEKVRRFNVKAPWSENSRIADIMRESVKCIREAGAEPVFMTTPLSHPLRAGFDARKVQALTNGVATLAAECGARYLNYLAYDLPLECWRDANHLNLAGAEVFTKRVAEDVERLEKP